MYDVKSAVKIALLENTGLAEVAINSVVEAVAKLTGDHPEKDADRYRWLCDGNGYFMEEQGICGYSNEKAIADGLIDEAMGQPIQPPCCWIIERVGHPVSITHYQTVADCQRSLGAVVTPHVSRLV